MTNFKHDAVLLARFMIDEGQITRVGPNRPVPIDPRCWTVIVGTNGSTDHLRDAAPDQYRPTQQDRRFWCVSVPHGEPAPDDGQDCDGLNDESGPIQNQCARCFPDRGDLAEPQEDEYDDARRDDDQEME